MRILMYICISHVCMYTGVEAQAQAPTEEAETVAPVAAPATADL